VVGIEKDSPASRSQIKEGDLIVSFNNKSVNTLNQLFKELTKKEILSMIDVSIVRFTELLTVNIFPTQRPN
jgi:S1-C subfamily serine protease